MKLIIILYALTDLIIEVWSIGRAPSVTAERCSSAPKGDRLEAEFAHPVNPRSTGKNIWRTPSDPVKLDPIRIRDEPSDEMRNTRQGPQGSEGSDAPILQQLMDAMGDLQETNEEQRREQ